MSVKCIIVNKQKKHTKTGFTRQVTEPKTAAAFTALQAAGVMVAEGGGSGQDRRVSIIRLFQRKERQKEQTKKNVFNLD